jgi:hypothetical protein
MRPHDRLLCAVDLLAMATRLTHLPQEVARQAEYWALSGCEGLSPYSSALKRLDALIGLLKGVRADVQALQQHAHDWDTDLYCRICGADGAA